MYSKDEVLTALNTLSRIMREVRALDNETKRLISVNAGCSATDVDECEGVVDAIHEYITDEMCDLDNIPALDIDANFDIIDDALEHVDRLSERHQISILDTVMRNVDCFDSNIEGLNELLKECNKPWLVIHRDEATRIKDLFDTL